mgnify:CR=1 FL=1
MDIAKYYSTFDKLGNKRTVSIGNENFADIIRNNDLYVDKTDFIKSWWEARTKVTLITRPRRFGKTLALSMIECFFSNEYVNQQDMFKNLSIYNDDSFMSLQGSYPVIRLSLNGTDSDNYETTREFICQKIRKLYYKFDKELGNRLDGTDRLCFEAVYATMTDVVASDAISTLMFILYKYYNKPVIVLIDEYDYPMQKAYECGYWEKLVAFLRSILTNTLKSNDYLERALLTGITLVSKESIFSGLNNISVNTVLDTEYATSFGFTDNEINIVLCEYDMLERKQEITSYYNGFKFGNENIYNPWSILNFLNKKKIGNYWVNTSGNALIDTLIRKGNNELQIDFEVLLSGGTITSMIDTRIVYKDLEYSDVAIYSLLVLSGYLKIVDIIDEIESIYTVGITNKETLNMFRSMVKSWFNRRQYEGFIKYLLDDNVEQMNMYLSQILLDTFSYFDSSEKEPERFYHGFTLGLIVELNTDYYIKSNRESGHGRYDLVLEPKSRNTNAIIIEFKVGDSFNSLEKVAKQAIEQIDKNRYDSDLLEKGFSNEQIKKYGIAFCKKEVIIVSE